MESWEEYDSLKDEEWPNLASSASVPNKKQNNNTQSKGFDLKSAHPYFEAQPAVKILTRNKNAQNTPSTVNTTKHDSLVTTESHQKTLEQREQEYLEARKRILGNNESVGNTESNKQSPIVANKSKTGKGKSQQQST